MYQPNQSSPDDTVREDAVAGIPSKSTDAIPYTANLKRTLPMKRKAGPLTIYGLPVLLLSVLLAAALRIHNLSNETENLSAQKSELHVEKLGLIGELATERSTTADLNVEIGELEGQLKESVELNVALDKEVQGLNGELANLNRELESSLAREVGLKSELTDMSLLKVKLEKQIFSLETDVSEQENRIGQLTTRISELQYSLAEARERSSILMSNNDGLMEQVEGMTKRLATSENQNEVHRETISALTEEGSTLVKHTEKLNAQLADMTNRFDQLSLEAEDTNSKLNSVTGERNSLQAEATKLSEYLSTTEEEKRGLSDELGVLSDNFKTVKINNTNLTAAYEELVAEAKYHEEINATLEEDLMEQVEHADTLRTTIAVLEDRLKKSEIQVNLVSAESDDRATQLDKLQAMLEESDRIKAGLSETVKQLESALATSRQEYDGVSKELLAQGTEFEVIQTRMAEATAELSAQQTMIDSYHNKLQKMEAISIDCARLMADESGENAQVNDKIDLLEQALLVIKAQAEQSPKINISTTEDAITP